MPKLRLVATPSEKDWGKELLSNIPPQSLARTMVRGLYVSTVHLPWLDSFTFDILPFETQVFDKADLTGLARWNLHTENEALVLHDELVRQISKGEGDLLDESWPCEASLEVVSWRRIGVRPLIEEAT